MPISFMLWMHLWIGWIDLHSKSMKDLKELKEVTEAEVDTYEDGMVKEDHLDSTIVMNMDTLQEIVHCQEDLVVHTTRTTPMLLKNVLI
jgi:hypothetical protein